MPKPYVLPPKWRQNTEYHVCQHGDCKEQAAFAMLGQPRPLLDSLTYIHLCPKHHREIEELHEQLEANWGRGQAGERLNEYLGWMIRKP
jgi:hypothetical protein